MKIKQELLEYLIRTCAREVLSQVNEGLGEKAFKDSFKVPEKDLPFIQDLMDKHGLSYEQAIRDYLEMYGNDKSSKPMIKPSVSDRFSSGKFNPRNEARGDFGTDAKGDDETTGAAAPPEDGQGSGDQLAIDKEKDTTPETPTEPETPPSVDLKGVMFVDPKDKAKLKKIAIKATDDAGVERELHSAGAKVAGSRIKVALSTSRLVKDAVKNPNTSVYLYLGKYDPNSDEIFLMADKSLQVAKDSSIPPSEMGVSQPAYALRDPMGNGASPDDVAQNLAQATPAYSDRSAKQDVDENLKRAIKKMVKEILTQK